MTITSAGYDGTVNEQVWGGHGSTYGSLPGVAGKDDFYVFLSGGDTVTVRAGTAYGRGVVDTLSGDTTLTMTRPTSGVRYDVVVLRRDFGTNETSIAAVPGGADRAMPRLAHTDLLDEQALSLVQVPASGDLVISDDLR